MAGEFQRFIPGARPTTQGSAISPIGVALGATPAIAEAGLSIRDAVQLESVSDDLNALRADNPEDDVDLLDAEASLNTLVAARDQGLGNEIGFQAKAMTILQNAALRNPRIGSRLNLLAGTLGVGGRRGTGSTALSPVEKARNDALEQVEAIRLTGLSQEDAVKKFQDMAGMAQKSAVLDFNKKLIEFSNLNLTQKQTSYTSLSSNISEALVNDSFTAVVDQIPLSNEGLSPNDFLSNSKQLYALAGNDPAAIANATLEIKRQVAAAKAVFLDKLSDEQANAQGQMTPATRTAMQKTGEDLFATLDTQLNSSNPQAFLDTFNKLSISVSQADAIRVLQKMGDPLSRGMIPVISTQGTLVVLQGIQAMADIQAQIKNRPDLAALAATLPGKDGTLMRAFLDNPTGLMDVPSTIGLFNTGDFDSWGIPDRLINQDTYGPVYSGVMNDNRTDEEVTAEVEDVVDAEDNPVVVNPDQRTKFMNTIKAATSKPSTLPLLLNPETARRLSSDKQAQDWYDDAFRRRIKAWGTEVINTFKQWDDKVVRITIPDDGQFVVTSVVGTNNIRAIRRPVPMFEAEFTQTKAVPRVGNVTINETDGNRLFDTMVAAMGNYRSPEEIDTFLRANFGTTLDLLGIRVEINGVPITFEDENTGHLDEER